MKEKTYLKCRNEFLNQYSLIQKNELGFVRLEQFKIRNFKKFLFLFSLDFLDCHYNNHVKALGIKSFIIRNRPVTSIKIISEHSMFDKHQGQFHKALQFFQELTKNHNEKNSYR